MVKKILSKITFCFEPYNSLWLEYDTNRTNCHAAANEVHTFVAETDCPCLPPVKRGFA